MLGRCEDVTVVDDTYYVKQGENYKAYTEDQVKAKWAILPTNLDAVALLQKVEPSIEAARYLGTDNVNGVSAGHYRFVVDSKALGSTARTARCATRCSTSSAASTCSTRATSRT
ncbi:hypothetical protein [Nigerium massiliense]|uniref:hypothetical protein n=1 Tax=Nigerium massiliense TaxID=1522317 RepID=UPI00058CCAAA|nr:hypothetical protein [Nigerium massiliense]